MENSIQKQVNTDNTNSENNRRIIFKVLIGFAIIAILFIVTIKITNDKLSQLSKTVSTILEPNIRLITLKEISSCLYSAEANVKAYTIRLDTAYLLTYKYHISNLNSQLDTLLWLSTKNKIVTKNEQKANQIFKENIDSLRKLIAIRVDLFNQYISVKTSDSSQTGLNKLLQKIQINKPILIQNSTPEIKPQKKSAFARFFSSKKDKKEIVNVSLPAVTANLVHDNIQKIITETQIEENQITGNELSKEIEITQREYRVMSQIFSHLNKLEDIELHERIKRIDIATAETNSQINFISNWITLLGLLLAIIISYFIYRDILRVKHFKEHLLMAKRNIEKLASQYSLSLIEASRDPLFTINSDGKIMDMNHASEKITGLQREKLIGTYFLDYFTEPEKAKDGYLKIFSKGSVADFPLTIRNIDGKLTEVLFNGSVYKDDKGKVLGVVAVARDITNQKIFENELIDAKSKAEQSNKLKEAFLANMSHEIRTPMNAIIGFSDLLSDRELDDEAKEYAKTIKSAGENLLVIINDILDISKIEAGMMTFMKDVFSISGTLKSLNILLMEKAKVKNIDLIFTSDKNVPNVVLGDHTRLTQIIINLVGNAIKFTEKGQVHLNVKTLKSDSENVLLEFTISDTGIGIAEDKLEKIFDRFSQAEKQTTRLYGGTGLGLSIAQQLVELQGGTISVESELNVGSVFSFTISYKKTAINQLSPDKTGAEFEMDDLCKLNILLVEDNLLNIKLISCLFAENNLTLQIAENGLLGIQKLKENNFDIILMDMEMPVMTGYEATKVIRDELKNDIPIIAMTAHAMSGEREHCLNLGMNDYISKPINSMLLFEKINELTVGKM